MVASGTTLVALKAALLSAFKQSPAFSGVEVSYGQKPSGRREQVWLGVASIGEQEPAGIRQGKKRRYEDYEVEIYVNVMGKPSPDKCELRALELVTAISDIVADPEAIDVPGLMWATVGRVEWDTAETGEGPITTVQIIVNANGNLL